MLPSLNLRKSDLAVCRVTTPSITPFSEEQARTLINLEQRYEVWMKAERALMRLPYDMHRKTIGVYLYETRDRLGNGHSPEPWSAEQEQRLAAYHDRKAAAQQRQREGKARLDESGAQFRRPQSGAS